MSKFSIVIIFIFEFYLNYIIIQREEIILQQYYFCFSFNQMHIFLFVVVPWTLLTVVLISFFLDFHACFVKHNIVRLSIITCARPLAPQLPFVTKTVDVAWTVALLPQQSATPNLELFSTPNLEFSSRSHT